MTGWIDRWPSIGMVRTSGRQEEVAWKADFLIVPDSMLAKPGSTSAFEAEDEASRRGRGVTSQGMHQREVHRILPGTHEGYVLSGLFQEARHVVFLDGSPMPNRPMELWAPTYALCPEAIDCMSMNDFGYRYCGARPNERGEWEYKYSSHEGELNQKLTRDFMHVVTESELQHPERRRLMLFMSETSVRSSRDLGT